MEKELKITPPEGYEIDRELSTFDCIKFKRIETKSWRENKDSKISGCFINSDSSIIPIENLHNLSINYNTFATEKQAKSALAMARISQILANDGRFGGIVTDDEWRNVEICKYCICREHNKIYCCIYFNEYHFLAFHTQEQRDLFIMENEDLIKDYLMIY